LLEGFITSNCDFLLLVVVAVLSRHDSSLASLTWMSLDLLFTGKPSVVGIINGSLAGLVAITPAAGYVNPTGAFIIGVAGGIACSQGVKIKNYFNFDDALDAFGIHAVGGVVGGLLVGCLAMESIGEVRGLFYGNPKQLGLQLYGMSVTIAWSVIGTGIIMLTVDMVFGLRVSASKELIGLDRTQHASTMYSQITNAPQRAVPDKRVRGRSHVLTHLYRRLWGLRGLDVDPATPPASPRPPDASSSQDGEPFFPDSSPSCGVSTSGSLTDEASSHTVVGSSLFPGDDTIDSEIAVKCSSDTEGISVAVSEVVEAGEGRTDGVELSKTHHRLILSVGHKDSNDGDDNDDGDGNSDGSGKEPQGRTVAATSLLVSTDDETAL
jgi:hypothetical protein